MISDDGQALDNLSVSVRLEHNHLLLAVELGAVDIELRDDSKGSFRSNEAMFEVESRIIFLNFGRHVQDVAIWENHL